MSLSSLLKQLRKKLKSGKRRLMLGLLLLFVGAGMLGLWLFQTSTFDKPVLTVFNSVKHISPQEEILHEIESEQAARRVFVQKNYVCGQETEEVGMRLPAEILQLHLEHPRLTISKNEQGHVYFVEEINDLSTFCKQNAFFGLDKQGNFTLFSGLPNQDKVIRTFFQMNIDHLKSSLPKEALDQLYEGIRVTDLEEYNSVLSTFNDYAVEVGSKL